MIMHKVSHDTYYRRGISNMQLYDQPHGTWAGACHTSDPLGSPSAFISGGSKVIHGIIARKEREPGNEASMFSVVRLEIL